RAVYLVDEIGKMECLSSAFVEAVMRLLDSGRPLIATVAQRGAGFIADVKRHPDAELWQGMRETRDGLPARLVRWLGGLWTRRITLRGGVFLRTIFGSPFNRSVGGTTGN